MGPLFDDPPYAQTLTESLAGKENRDASFGG
jgi:hypothetical protein